VRRNVEGEGLRTIREESAIEISGLPFVHAILQVAGQGQHTHYRGIYTTFLNGYILSLDVTAASPERLQQVVLGMVKFRATGK
jgi:hypothetical protein